ncbi:MAG: S-methyl-5'-thioinosine phosphorylase [Abditibacteriaceae bacterium]
MKRVAIIGGTGWASNAPQNTFTKREAETVSTRWGNANVFFCPMDDHEIIFIHRHVSPESTTHLPPHRINYRANIAALKELNVDLIFACSAVGCLRADWQSGSFALLDQIIDFTSGRESTFHDDEAVHIDMTSPYDERGKVLLREAASQNNIDLYESAVYLCTNGPRFETAAEIRMFAQWGADVVGMTGMPEVALARELQIPYAGIVVITNAAAGISQSPLTHEEVQIEMQCALPKLTSLIMDAAKIA